MKTDIFKVAEAKISYTPKVSPKERYSIKSSQDTYKMIQERQVFDPATIEHHETFKVILLNRALKVLGVTTITEGGMTSCNVDIRLVLQAALLANASSLIMLHNHPSGQLIASNEDRVLTERIISAAKLMNITILDHLIVSATDYYSFADNGLL